MSAPTEESWIALTRLVKHFLGKPRAIFRICIFALLLIFWREISHANSDVNQSIMRKIKCTKKKRR